MDKMDVKLVVDGKEYKYVIPDDLNISEPTINTDLANHTAKVVWHGVLTARLVSAQERASQRLKEARATADEAVRAGFAAAGIKSTEAMVTAKVETTPVVQGALKEYQFANEQVNVAQAIKDAFYHRKDMLVSLGAMMRDQSHPDHINAGKR